MPDDDISTSDPSDLLNYEERLPKSLTNQALLYFCFHH
jgi:hypothetical protein